MKTLLIFFIGGALSIFIKVFFPQLWLSIVGILIFSFIVAWSIKLLFLTERFLIDLITGQKRISTAKTKAYDHQAFWSK